MAEDGASTSTLLNILKGNKTPRVDGDSDDGPAQMSISHSERQARENCVHQTQVRELYETPHVQITVAALIFGNFVSAILRHMIPARH